MSRRKPVGVPIADLGRPKGNPQNLAPAVRKHLSQRGRVAGPPKYQIPTGGGEQPPIPRLDGSYAEGRTMADAALMQREQEKSEALEAGLQQAGIFQNAQALGGGAQQASPTLDHPDQRVRLNHALDIRPMDLLPKSAMEDPRYRSGMGGQYAVSQPELAAAHGVMRDGEYIPPQVLQNKMREQMGHGVIRKQTQEGLKQLAEAQLLQKATEESIKDKIEHPGQETAEAASKLSPPGDDKDLLSDDELKYVKPPEDRFDYDRLRDMQRKDILNNPKQKELIESRLKPMDVGDIVVKGYVEQVVPIQPGTFEVTFKSLTTEEDLALKRLIGEDMTNMELSDVYIRDKFSMMAVICSIVAVGDRKLPTHLDAEGNFDDDKFWKKFTQVTKFPFQMIAALGIHYYWFDMRVRALFEMVGNG